MYICINNNKIKTKTQDKQIFEYLSRVGVTYKNALWQSQSLNLFIIYEHTYKRYIYKILENKNWKKKTYISTYLYNVDIVSCEKKL